MKMTKILNFLLKSFLFLLPWQTIWLYREVFINGAKWQYGTLGFYVTEILLWLIIVLFMIWYWRQRKDKQEVKKEKFKFTNDRIFVLSCFVFVVYSSLSVFWSLDKSVALQQSLYIMEMFLLFFVIYLGPLKYKEILRWLLLGSILPILLGFFQFIFQATFASKYFGLTLHLAWEAGSSIVSGEAGRFLRAYGPVAHPNIFGGYLLLVLFSAILFFSNKEKIKIINYFFLGLIILSLFFTFSRSALLAGLSLVIFFIFYAFSQKKKNLKHLTIFSLLIFVVFFISLWPVFQTRVLINSANEMESVVERADSAVEALEIWQNNKWFGVGVGNYTVVLTHKYSNLSGWQYQPVHNTFLLILVELGLVGLSLSFLVGIMFLYFIYSKAKSRLFWLVLLSAPLLFIMLFDHYLYSFYVGLAIFGLYLAILTRSLPFNIHK